MRWLAFFLPLWPLLVVGSLGCSERPPAPTAAFVAGTEEEAARQVRAFLDAYQAADVDKALSLLCERDAATRAFLQRSLAPGSPFHITSYQIGSVTPLWERKQPLYLVGVLLPRRSGPPIEHGYRVRVTDGCIERLFADLMAPAPQGAPASPHESFRSPHPRAPPPRPTTPPSDADDPAQAWVDDEDRWGPSLPAAPVSADDEVIDL